MEDKDNVKRLAIDGELSIFTAASLRERLLEALGEGTEIEVDLGNVSEMDSAGVQLLLAAKREAAKRSTTLRITGRSPAVLDVLELCELTGRFNDPVQIHSPS